MQIRFKAANKDGRNKNCMRSEKFWVSWHRARVADADESCKKLKQKSTAHTEKMLMERCERGEYPNGLHNEECARVKCKGEPGTRAFPSMQNGC